MEASTEEAILTAVETLTSTSKLIPLIFLGLLLSGLTVAQGDYYYNDDSSLGDWGTIPEFDSQEELVGQFVAPFLFVFVLLQFSLKKALAFTFDDGSDRPAPWEDDGPSVQKEATVMALAISLMLVASPYWSLIQTMAASIGLITVGSLILVLLFLIYMFVRP